jgi:nitrate/nitrite-specific signal transduction histidine kinase
LIRNIHHFLLEEDDLSSQEALALINKLRQKVEDYRTHELEEEKGKEKHEIEQLDIMLNDIKNLETVKTLLDEFKTKGTYDADSLVGLEEFAYEIEETADLINRIHLIKIKKRSEESLSNMWLILFIYLLFASIGGLSIYAGHRMLLKNVVLPIKALSSATIEFAGGTYDKRVQTDSKSEIGLLYQ